jgi:2-polyprenyl-3-methyl-5-hydroxy-6-metoxy-1,4-benzoquinol methylase
MGRTAENQTSFQALMVLLNLLVSYRVLYTMLTITNHIVYLFQDKVVSRALDIGCAVGRSTFELARQYDEVIGIDFSEAFVKECESLKRTGQATYSLPVEGDLVEEKTATVDPIIVSFHITTKSMESETTWIFVADCSLS